MDSGQAYYRGVGGGECLASRTSHNLQFGGSGGTGQSRTPAPWRAGQTGGASRKHEKLHQCWVNAGPPSTTVAQHSPSIGSIPPGALSHKVCLANRRWFMPSQGYYKARNTLAPGWSWALSTTARPLSDPTPSPFMHGSQIYCNSCKILIFTYTCAIAGWLILFIVVCSDIYSALRPSWCITVQRARSLNSFCMHTTWKHKIVGLIKEA